MRILITFARAYPMQSAIMLFALALAGIAEGLGLTALLPLLGMAFSSQAQSAPLQPTAAAGNDAGVGHTVNQILTFLGLEPSAGLLLLVIVLTDSMVENWSSSTSVISVSTTLGLAPR